MSTGTYMRAARNQPEGDRVDQDDYAWATGKLLADIRRLAPTLTPKAQMRLAASAMTIARNIGASDPRHLRLVARRVAQERLPAFA